MWSSTILRKGSHSGTTLCFRGLDNAAYYILEADRSRYANYSGTGNTLNANHPIVRRMILDSLRHWVREMHIDGFRFDLASVLSRDASGQVMPNPPVLWDIESDPTLAAPTHRRGVGRRGPYQVGCFIFASTTFVRSRPWQPLAIRRQGDWRHQDHAD